MARCTHLRRAACVLTLGAVACSYAVFGSPPSLRAFAPELRRDQAVAHSAEAESPTVAAQAPPKQAVVDTSAGTFVIDLTPATAPNQTAYFMKLAAEGGYDGTIFHRAVKYGMVQGGDPLSRDPSKRA